LRKEKGEEMKDLQDYSGEFIPDIRLQDFSKDALIRLLQEASRNYLGHDLVWAETIGKRYGEASFSCHKEVWELGTPNEVLRGTRAMNISGNDVAAFLKYLQIDPGFGVLFGIKCELPSPDLGVLTVTHCPGLEWAEQYGPTEDFKKMACEEMEVPLFLKAAKLFNPNMKVNALKLPPRNSADDIACQWEIRLEPGYDGPRPLDQYKIENAFVELARPKA
jgi:hypothetical protein